MIAQYVADGVVSGALVGLGAIGLTLTYAVLGFANFAQGEFLTWGAYFALALLSGTGLGHAAALPPFAFGWPLLLVLPAAVALTGGLAVALDHVLFRPLRRRAGPMGLVIASFGASLALANLVVLLFGPKPRYFSRAIAFAMPVAPGVRLTADRMLVVALALLAMAALHLLLTRSRLGLAMRASAENPALAAVYGVDAEGVRRASWWIGGGMSALAGVLLGQTEQIQPLMGADMLLSLFAAAILGGIGSAGGAFAGGLIVGLAEALSVPLLGAAYRPAAAFLVLFAVLMLRPTGLFGERP
ncbi:MAG: branched-chain amino acid ABC transporter permease [Acetobacteraceae bacterium]